MHQRLREKGWTKSEIEDTIDILEDPAKQKKHLGMKQEIHKAIYWLVLLVLTLGNFFVSLALIPFLLVLSPTQITFVVVALGLVLGAMFSNLIWSIEHIEPAHHLVAAIFIPTVAIINVFIMAQISFSMASKIGAEGTGNPYVVSVTYAVAFLIPYGYSHVKNWIVSRR